ncbi:MAG TPA: MlaD family protein [Terriglobales bacterium]|nr:MlaD family protein [Terriglobales bacterium]
MPSQRQVKWAQLRVGVTVLFAAVTLAVLIFLMSGTGGFLARKIILKSYFDNAGGLRIGAPVRLQGVDIGNVKAIQVVPSHGLTPVEVVMKINKGFQPDLHIDSLASMSTVGVLGESFVDIDSTQAKGRQVHDGDVLPIRDHPDLQDMIRASQTSLQNIDVLVRRIDRIVGFIESGQGSIGKLIYDQELYNRLNTALTQVQSMVTEISSGKGSIGKLIATDELYDKANLAVDHLNQIIDEVNQGQGTVGKLLKDPSLYNNANSTIDKVNKVMADVNEGKGALGKFTRDQAFANKLDNTVTKLSTIMDRLEAGEGTAGKLLRDPSLFVNADQMLIETRGLVQAIRENPKKYLTIHFKVF